MRLRWWILGATAVTLGGVLVVKHVVENKEKYIRSTKNEKEKNNPDSTANLYESEFEGTDFLV